jgi:hypothetical protein
VGACTPGAGWNVFDFIVVTLGVIAEIFPDVPVMNDIRLLRVFRAVRLFRKLKSLRLIFNALIASLVPVINSVLILGIVTAMCATTPLIPGSSLT